MGRERRMVRLSNTSIKAVGHHLFQAIHGPDMDLQLPFAGKVFIGVQEEGITRQGKKSVAASLLRQLEVSLFISRISRCED